MLDTIAQLEAEVSAGNFAFTAPEAGSIADVANYPKEFAHTDIAAPTWEEEK